MIGYLDPMLFPDECQVYAIPDGTYVYPIFKNGSSSLKRDMRLVDQIELSAIKTVDVFIREPLDRYVSGVQTYLKFLSPSHDRETMLLTIDEFLFMNRHFSLQFHWLMNLARQSNALIHIRNVSEISSVTNRRIHVVARDMQLMKRFEGNTRLRYYLLLDKILYEDLMGKTMSFSQIVDYIKTNYADLYDDVILRSKNICSVLD